MFCSVSMMISGQRAASMAIRVVEQVIIVYSNSFGSGRPAPSALLFCLAFVAVFLVEAFPASPRVSTSAILV
jgi:hypothetical protein